MIKIFNFIVLFFYITSCSLHDTAGFWSKKSELDKENLQFQVLFEKKKDNEVEFNNDLTINTDLSQQKINSNSKFDNNDGFILFNGKIVNSSKFKFSKIKNFEKIEPNLIFNEEKIIFFDNKGSILCFDKNSNLIWQQNIYSKDEKKIGPLLMMHKRDDHLVVADNLARYYLLNINTGEVIWEKRHNAPFNSEIKTYKKRIFIVDSNNTLNSFLIKDGTKIWSHITEKSFINSSKRLSVVISNDRVFFNNSIGDITAVNARNGQLIWQSVTFNSKIYEELMNLKTSDLIIDQNFLYFSNNKNQFYSLDVETGKINWIQNILSNLKPTIVNGLIFTFSKKGFQYILDQQTGNIIRINDIFYQFNEKKRENIFPIGFLINKENIFITTSNGKLLVLNWKNGKIEEVLNIDKNTISRPFINNQTMYLIKENSIIKLN